MKMKLTTKLLGILIASIALVACGGGGSDPVVKTEKVWRLKEKVTGNTKVTFDYDGSGNLIKQSHGGLGANSLIEYFEFDYDDDSVLLTRKAYSAFTGKLTRLIKFDDRGEVVLSTRGDASGEPILPADQVYINTYNDDERDHDEERNLVQRKILTILDNNTIYDYPGSKLISRDRSGTRDEILHYIEEINKITISGFDKPDDGVADNLVVTTFNDQGDIELIVFNGNVFLNKSYTYNFDANGNLEKSVMTNLVNGAAGVTTHYTWEPMDIPAR